MPLQIVTVRVDGGPKVDVPWTAGMNGEVALKQAYEILHAQAPNSFSFAVTYYGQTLGYLVSMINQTYDSFIPTDSKMSPAFFWEIYQNGVPATTGIDEMVLNAGDELLFKFETYDPVVHAQSTLAAKNNARTS